MALGGNDLSTLPLNVHENAQRSSAFNLFPAYVPTQEHNFEVLFPLVGKAKTQLFF